MIVASQAIRWTVLVEMGTENSISAAGDPGKPARVCSDVVTWRCGRWLACCGTIPASRELDQGIGEPALATPVVADSRWASQRLQRGAKCGPASRIEPPTHEDRPVLAGAELEPARLDGIPLLLGNSFRVSRMPNVLADVPEAANAILPSLLQQLPLIQSLPAPRLRQGAGGSGDQGEMGESDRAPDHSLGAARLAG